jgi:glycosyltransferase involved in cell wall biosynthesis
MRRRATATGRLRGPNAAGLEVEPEARAFPVTATDTLNSVSQKPRPVLLMTRTLGHGGTERQLTETALSLNRDLFTPHVCCIEGGGVRADQLAQAGIPILELPMSSLVSKQCMAGMVRLRRYLREHRIEVVHAFDTPMNLFGVPVASFLGIPVVLSSQRCNEDVIWQPYRRPQRLAHALADGVVANCEAMRQHLLKDYSLPPRKVELCYNGIDTSVFHTDVRTQPDGVRDASLVIGSVCVLRQEKSIETLVDAFAQMRHIAPGLKLLIVGSGVQREALIARSVELGLASDAFFFPTTSDVPYWLHAIDIFVLPSISEALSNSLMEAMACGCCAVASRVGGNPELVRPDETGLLFESGNVSDLADQLTVLVQDAALRHRLATTGATWIAENMSQASSARKMESIYLRYLD